MRTSIFFLMTIILLSSCSESNSSNTMEMAAKTYPTVGSIEVLDEGLSKIISSDAAIELLAEGFSWSEGPVWVEALNSVLFTDVPENKIWRWSEKDSLQLYLEPSGYLGSTKGGQGANGLWIDSEGKLVMCQHGERQIAYMDAPLDAPAPKFVSLASQYEGKRFSSPNDLVIDKKGNIYFTDPPYGLPKDVEQEIPFQGVFRKNIDGSIDLLVDSLSRPNGVALSPDEKTMYIAVSDGQKAHLLAYDIQEDGTVTNGRILCDTTPEVGMEGRKGVPDGLVVHSNGTIFTTGPGGIWVVAPDGKVLGKILTTQSTANCTLDADEKMLYMTAHMYLMRVPLL